MVVPVISWLAAAALAVIAIAITPPIVAAVSVSSEGEALLQSRWQWWRVYTNTTSHHCNWPGIACNDAGSVVAISPPSSAKMYQGRNEIKNMNFSCFPNLVWLKLIRAELIGNIPPQIFGIPKLKYLDLSYNSLSGQLPSYIPRFNQLVELDISGNYDIDGSIPSEIGNLKKLVVLRMSGIQFQGSVPSEILNLKNLVELDLSNTDINGTIPDEIRNLKNLVNLDLSHNSIIGSIPGEICNLKNLMMLGLRNNRINGTIPDDIYNLKNLVELDLSNNSITGTIPGEICNLKNLEGLDLESNQLSGPIPNSLGNCSNLKLLFLNNNELEGSIPGDICNLKNLEGLDLRSNQLSGPIPKSLGNCSNLKVLFLNDNELEGSILGEICNLKKLEGLDMSNNRINGRIPQGIGALKSLTWLYLNSNQLSGSITPSLGKCSNLQFLKLCNNSLNGEIPFVQLSKLNHLINVDVSYNNLSGVIPFNCFVPDSWKFEGNKNLSGNYLSCPYDTSSSLILDYGIKVIVPIMAFLFLLFLAYFFLSHRKVKKTRVEATSNQNRDLFSIWNYDGQIAYQDILSATEDFDIRYCIGTGGYGSVYKAELPSGRIVALKKLHRLEAEEPAFDRSFKNEVKLLTEIRHRNIVKLHGFCLHNRCMFLVYEYMEKGSLFCALRNDEEAVALGWKQRVNIVKDIALALSYLHHDCTPPIVHRDISSSNILLNSESQAFVADFGVARLLNPDASCWHMDF